jgi:hypothetical protein
MGTSTEGILSELKALAEKGIEVAHDELVKGAGRGAVVVIELVLRLMQGRTVEQAIEILEHLVETGAKPITAAELSAQTADVLKQFEP